MENRKMKVLLDRKGADQASEFIRSCLEEAGIKGRDILRIRVTMENLLDNICLRDEPPVHAELTFRKWIGFFTLKVTYDGERYDPIKPADSETEAFTSSVLTHTGIFPFWKWRGGHNELTLNIPAAKGSPEIAMLACAAAAVVLGLLGGYIPEPVRNLLSENVLYFLSQGFLNLLNTFVGFMVFFNIITGICGIGSAASLGRIGKYMITRFLVLTFVIGGVFTFGVSLLCPLQYGGTGSSFEQLHTVLEMIFGLLPSNPVKPFLEGNTLQIVFLAVLIGCVLTAAGSQTETLRSLITEAQLAVVRCMEIICMFLPVYVFSSLTQQLWANGPDVLIRFWKPIAVSILLTAILVIVYLGVTCRIVKVKPSVLVPKLLPDFLIGLSTASSSAAMSLSMEINEKKLGIEGSFSRMAYPISIILFGSSYTMLYIITAVFLAECAGVHADMAWWITLWILCSLFSIATPPVPGGNISCLSVLMTQMHIPLGGLALGCALTMILDFPCTGARIALVHLEMLQQAEKLRLLNHDVLQEAG